MKLPKRLSAAAELVPEGAVLTDIGTDHGFLPIALVESHRIKSAIAMDVREGPLSRAREHVERAGLKDCIDLRLSDGFFALEKGEADTASILGMGGPLMIRLLEEGTPGEKGIQTLILGPQSEVPFVRAYLLRREWRIEEERLVSEDGKYYFLLKAVPGIGEEEPYTEAELLFGRSLLAARDPVLSDYLDYRRRILGEILESLGRSPGQEERRREIRSEIELVERVSQQYGIEEEQNHAI